MPMPGISASGAKVLLGIGLEDRVTGKQTGCPRPVAAEIAAPAAALTVTPGGAGNVSGNGVSYKYSKTTISRGETECSPASVPQLVSSKEVALSGFVWGSDPDDEIDGLRAYRRIDALGSDLVTNGDFATVLTPWSGAAWAQSSGTALHTAGTATALTQNITVTSGRKYQVIFTVSGRTAGTITPGIGAVNGAAVSADGTYCQYITAAASGSVALNFTPASAFDGALDDISVKEITTEGSWKHIGTIWDSTQVTVTLTDNLAAGSEDTTRSPKSANETANNFALQFIEVDPTPIVQRTPNKITTNAATGTLGKPKSITTGAAYPVDVSGSVRTGPIVPFFASQQGAPTVVREANEPVWTYTFPLSDDADDAASFWGMVDRGGDPRPTIFRGGKINEIELSLALAAEIGFKAKGLALSDTESSPGYPDSGNTGTYKLAPVLIGTRADATAYTDSLIVECTQALAAGEMKVKAKIGSGGTWGPDLTVYCDSADKQIAGPADDEDATRLHGPDGPLGFDASENLDPLSVRFPGALDGIDVGDSWEFLPQILHPVPRSGAAYSNEARLAAAIGLPRFGPANVTIKKGSSTADTVVLAEASTVKISRTAAPKNWFGAAAKRAKDVTPSGYVMVEIGFDKEFDSRTFDRASRAEERFVVEVLIEGPKIWTNPGTYSTFREQIKLTLAQADVLSVVTVGGLGPVKEKVTFLCEQPADGSQAFTAEIVSAMGWNFAATA